jgi:DNA-binding IclR family transcriptional regulator
MRAGRTPRQPADAAVKARDQNKATTRVLAVLSSFASDTEAFGVTELSQRLGMTKNMVHRALTTLVDQGYLVRDETGTRYELGYRVVELQNPHVPDPDLRDLCAPAIHAFHRVTGETVSVCVRHGDVIVFIDGFETRKPGVWRLSVGDLRPLHSAASPRAILANLSDAEIDAYIERNSPLLLTGSDEITSREQLWEELRRIRADGFALNFRHVRPFMVSVAFPIWAADGHIQGAIAVGGPVERFDSRLQHVLPELRRIADELNARTRLYPLGISSV